MLFKMLKAERLKLHRSPLWIAFLLLPVIPALLGTLNYLGNIEILKSNWYSLWTQHTLFTCYFFLPLLIGVYCSYIMHEENKNQNWNKVLTMPIPRSLVFLSKLITAGGMAVLSIVWIGILFIASGKIIGIDVPIPIKEVLSWCASGVIGAIVMVAIQLMLSLFIKNFATPIAIAFGGGISGLVFLAKGFGHIWPYSLMAYGMNSNSPQTLIRSGYIPFVLICVFYVIIFTITSNIILSKKDI